MRSLRMMFALTVGIAVSLVQQVKAAEPIMVGHQQRQHHHRLTLDSMSQSVRGMEYAVRGAVVILADQLSRELANAKGKNDLLVDDDDDKYPLFDHIVYTNIGNPQYVLLVVVVVGACSSLGLAVHYVGSFSCWLILSLMPTTKLIFFVSLSLSLVFTLCLCV